MPEIGVEYTVADYAHPDFRIRAERARGIVADEALTFPNIAWSGYGDRPRLDIVLRGDIRDRENGVTRFLRRGDFAIGRALESLYMRVEGEDMLSLSIEWNLGSLGTSAPIGLPSGTLSASDLELVTVATEQLIANVPRGCGDQRAAAEGGDRHAVVGTIGRLVACLRSAGLPFDAWKARDLVAPVPAVLQRVADAVGRSLSSLASKPGAADLERELGVSRRRVADLVSDLAAKYGLNGGDWRTIRDRWRLNTALLAMSHPRARTESVATAVGYGSPNALCHAFREANIPSPGSIRDALARLA